MCLVRRSFPALECMCVILRNQYWKKNCVIYILWEIHVKWWVSNARELDEFEESILSYNNGVKCIVIYILEMFWKHSAAVSNIPIFCEYSPNYILHVDSSYQTRREIFLNLNLVFSFFFTYVIIT